MTYLLVSLFILAVLAGGIVFACCFLAGAADRLIEHLSRRNRRRHNLGKWLHFHGGVR